MPVREYLEALEREWSVRHASSEFDLETLYMGGGTPSKLGGDGVFRLIELVHRRARVREGAEVTLEANPEDITPQAARAWVSAGVNRVSVGVQSFDDRVLAWMHRTHDSQAAIRSVNVLRDAGLDNVSIDLIFAVPDVLERDWDQDVWTTLDLQLSHISVYGLTIEPHTPLGRWVARTEVAEAGEQSFEAEFLRAHDALTSGGFEHYEVSNYAKQGSHSRHNWAYWARKPYGGLGPSAHEFDGNARRWNVAAYAEWVARTARNEDPVEGHEALTPEQVHAEEVYLGLRTAAGFRTSDSQAARVSRLVDSGWARSDAESTLRLTGSGWLRLDSIAADLTALRSH